MTEPAIVRAVHRRWRVRVVRRPDAEIRIAELERLLEWAANEIRESRQTIAMQAHQLADFHKGNSSVTVRGLTPP